MHCISESHFDLLDMVPDMLYQNIEMRLARSFVDRKLDEKLKYLRFLCELEVLYKNNTHN